METSAPTPHPSERRVRHILFLAECALRETALGCLSEWSLAGLPAGALYECLPALRHPTFGSWGYLLTSVVKAAEDVRRKGTPAHRRALAGAAALSARLDSLVRTLAAEELVMWRALLATVPVPARPRHLDVWRAMIALRNHAAHRWPTPAWWELAGAALAPVVELLINNAGAPSEAAAPWFLRGEDGDFSFDGLTSAGVPVYADRLGRRREEPSRAADVLGEIRRLMGREDVQENEFRKLLARLAPEETRGVLLGDYLVGPPVGRGGSATVHSARHLLTGRRVAVKILHADSGPEARARFLREAAYLKDVQHPHVVTIVDHGEEHWRVPAGVDVSSEPWFDEFRRSNPKTYIALEWIDGPSLEQLFQDRGASRTQLIEWFAQAVSALHAIHTARLVHRDVKPSNLMVDSRQQLYVMDFGVARRVDSSESRVSGPATTPGTFAYMSPEQLLAAGAESEIGPATDIYSVCATFYELFTGTRIYAHDRSSEQDVRAAKVGGVRPRPQRGRLSWELETLLLGGLESMPADRPHSAEILERDLRRVQQMQPIDYRRPPLHRRLWLAYRRNRPWVLGAAAAFLLSVGAVGIYLHGVRAELRGSYEERGRQLLLAGLPAEASLYLAEAYRMGLDTPALRFMLSQSMLAMESEIWHTRIPLIPDSLGVNTAKLDQAARLLLIVESGAIQVVDWRSAKKVLSRRQNDDEAPLKGGTLSPDGRFALVWSSLKVSGWSVETGRPILDKPLSSPKYARISDDGTIVAIAFGEDRAGPPGIEVLRLPGGETLATLRGPVGSSTSVDLCPSGNQMLIAFGSRASMCSIAVGGNTVRCVPSRAGPADLGRLCTAGRPISKAAPAEASEKSQTLWDTPGCPVNPQLTGLRPLGIGGTYLREGLFFKPREMRFGLGAVAAIGDGVAIWNQERELLWCSPDAVALAFHPLLPAAAIFRAASSRMEIRESRSGGVLSVFQTPVEPIANLEFSANGTYLLTAFQSGSIRLADISRLPLALFTDWQAAAWLNDGSVLISGLPPGQLTSGAGRDASYADLYRVTLNPLTIKWFGEGQLITEGGTLSLLSVTWPVATSRFLLLRTPDGKGYALHLFENVNGEWRTTLVREFKAVLAPGHEEQSPIAALSPDGSRYVESGPFDRDHGTSLRLAEAATGRVITALGAVYQADFVFDPSGRRLVLDDHDSGQVSVYETASGRKLLALEHGDFRNEDPQFGHHRVTWSPGGGYLAVPDQESVRIYAAPSWKQVANISIPTGDRYAVGLAFSSSRRYLAVNNGSETRVFETRTWRPVSSISFGGGSDALPTLSFTPDDLLAISCQPAGTAVVDASTGRILNTSPVGGLVSISPSGTAMLTAPAPEADLSKETPAIAVVHVLPRETRPASTILNIIHARTRLRLRNGALVAAGLDR